MGHITSQADGLKGNRGGSPGVAFSGGRGVSAFSCRRSHPFRRSSGFQYGSNALFCLSAFGGRATRSSTLRGVKYSGPCFYLSQRPEPDTPAIPMPPAAGSPALKPRCSALIFLEREKSEAPNTLKSQAGFCPRRVVISFGRYQPIENYI